jgi:membrane protease YdiL (CAAX protease family)
MSFSAYNTGDTGTEIPLPYARTRNFLDPGLSQDVMDPRSLETPSTPDARTAAQTGTLGFFVFSWAITWSFAAPAAVAWMRHEQPPPYAVACAGLSAFGPLLAALACSRGQLREVFGRFRAHPGWVLLSLAAPFSIHAVATALYAILGGQPSAWFHPPVKPEQLAALVVFPLGEEFGWRGFAHPRIVARHGLVRGSLMLGAAWGLWHLMYSITPQAAGFDAFTFGLMMLELPLYSLLIAWVFERAQRGMAVALAFHAGGHLDHIEHAPSTELGLHALHLLVLAVLAFFAARSLAARSRELRVPPVIASRLSQ